MSVSPATRGHKPTAEQHAYLTCQDTEQVLDLIIYCFTSVFYVCCPGDKLGANRQSSVHAN